MVVDEDRFLDSDSGEEEENSGEELPEVKEAKALVEEALSSEKISKESIQPAEVKPVEKALESESANVVLKDQKPVKEESKKEPKKEEIKTSKEVKDPAGESSWDEEEEQEQEQEDESSDEADSKPHIQKAAQQKIAKSQTITQIYVGNISWKATKKDIANFFNPYGEIEDVVFPKMKRRRDDEWIWVPEGWAFVRFKTHAQAKKALKGNGKSIIDRKIKVNLRNPSRLKERPPNVRTIYVSNLNYDATEKDLLDHFGTVGKITDIRLQKTHASSRKNNVGFAHIDFADSKSVDKAITELNGKPMLERSVRIDWAAGGAAEKESAKVPSSCRTVRITNVPKKVGRQAVSRLVFSKVGPCFVRFIRKGFNRGCFVDFKTNQQVKAALNAKMTMCGVKLRVCWAPEQGDHWVNPKYASADRIVFVMPVNLRAREEDVSKAMTKFGKVKHIVIEPHTKAAHCYVVFKEATAAAAAIKAGKVTIMEGDRKSDIKEYVKSDGKKLKRAQGTFLRSYSCAISNLPFTTSKKAFVNLCDKLIKGLEFSLIWKLQKEKFSGVVELVFEKRSDAAKASKEFKKQNIRGRELISVVVKKNGDTWKKSVEDLESIRKEPEPTPGKKKGKGKRKSSPSNDEKSAKRRKTEKNTSTGPKGQKRKRGTDEIGGEAESPLKKSK